MLMSLQMSQKTLYIMETLEWEKSLSGSTENLNALLQYFICSFCIPHVSFLQEVLDGWVWDVSSAVCVPNFNRSPDEASGRLRCFLCSIDEFEDRDCRSGMPAVLSFAVPMVCPKAQLWSLLLLALMSVAVGVPPTVCPPLLNRGSSSCLCFSWISVPQCEGDPDSRFGKQLLIGFWSTPQLAKLYPPKLLPSSTCGPISLGESWVWKKVVVAFLCIVAFFEVVAYFAWINNKRVYFSFKIWYIFWWRKQESHIFRYHKTMLPIKVYSTVETWPMSERDYVPTSIFGTLVESFTRNPPFKSKVLAYFLAKSGSRSPIGGKWPQSQTNKCLTQGSLAFYVTCWGATC